MSTTMMTPMPLETGFPQTLQPFPLDGGLQTGRPQAKTRKHFFIALVASFTALCLLLVLVFYGYVAWMLTYPYVAPLTSNPKAAAGLDYEDILFPSASGKTTVSGWYVPASDNDSDAVLASSAAKSERTVIFSHGYGANREEDWVPMYDLTKLLHGLHYNVVLFDYGYASQKYKAPATAGIEESQQLLAAVNFAKSRGAQEIVVWGFSMGAGTALQAALQTKDIDAMILDSTFLATADTMFHNVTQILPLPKFPSKQLIEMLLPTWSGTSLKQVPVDQILTKSFDIPLYIMHGTSDAKAPYQLAEQIAADQTNPLSRSWIVPNGQHEMLFRASPTEYIQRAALFLGQVDQQFQEMHPSKDHTQAT
ncbi:alpha/beta hydrolase family protein [Paenibacillus sp. BK033]|uniref:alpha/beta hydrolase n=1 Tax=Paenibacillus sp. BK033 TaxID=2512133 RepID=UPI001049E8C9|nr:alpha/beta fold hydrolase [Paenibacillus sp. BK033]TCM95749.1 alpha/beta hydrolase family protein [Paenibacillus sp. BK033]